MIECSGDTTYSGIKQFSLRIAGEPQLEGAKLIVRQDYRGAKTWQVVNRYFVGGKGETADRVFASGLSRQDAKALAKELLLRSVRGVEPGGRLVLWTMGKQA